MTFSKDLIPRLETSSGGRPQHYFATPSASATVWRTPLGELREGIHAQVTTDDYSIAVSGWVEDTESIKRVVVCTLAAMLPSTVLDDALNMMRDEIEFYHEDLQLTAHDREVIVSDGYAMVDNDDHARW